MPVEKIKANIPEAILEEATKNIEKSEEFVKPYHNTQRKLFDLYRNEYVPEVNKSITPIVNGNLYLANIETQMPIIDDYMPWVNFEAREENDTKYADVLQLRMDSLFDAGQLRVAAHQASKDAKIMRNGITQAKMVIETEAGLKGPVRVFKGLRFLPVDPKTFYPAPGFTGLDIREGQCDWLAFKTPIHISEIKRVYGLEVEAEGDLDKYGLFREKENEDKYGQYAIVWEYYYMDDDVQKYPYGRSLMWCQKQGIFDRPLDCHVPYFMIKNYTTAHIGWGISDVELCKPFVEVINSVLSNNADIAVNQNKPPMFGRQSWIDKLRGRLMHMIKAGIVVPAEPGDVRIERPSELSSSSLTVPDQLKAFLDVVSGVYDNFAGKAKSDQSGRAIAALQDAAMRRVRLHLSQDVRPYLQEIGEFSLNIVQKYDQQILNLKKQIDPMNYEWVKYDPNDLRDTEFNVVVSVGAADRAEKVAEAMDLYDKQIYGVEEVIDILPIRDKKAKLERYNNRMGIAAEKAKQEELKKVLGQMEPMIMEILVLNEKGTVRTERETIMLKLAKDKLMALVQQYPELMETPYWAAVPQDTQIEVLRAAFVRQMPEELQGVANAQ